METQIIKIQMIAQLIVKHRQAIQTRKKHRLTTVSYTHLQRITRAVKVQITIVSAKTSKIPKNPCFTGFLVSAHA